MSAREKTPVLPSFLIDDEKQKVGRTLKIAKTYYLRIGAENES
jgi:hypothetical protein